MFCLLFVIFCCVLCFVFCSVSDGSSFNDDLSFMHHSDFVEENWYPPICTLTEKQTHCLLMLYCMVLYCVTSNERGDDAI